MSRGSRGTRYGKEHEAARRRHVAAYTPGHTPCVLCGEVMRGPASRLDLAHAPGTEHVWLGLSHRACNRGAAGQLTDWHGRSRTADPEPRPFDWTGWKTAT